MKKLSLFIALLSFSFGATAQFEGTLEFRSETKKDTNNNVYYVKGNNVKLDQIGKKSGKVEGSFVFDLAAGTIRFVNPARKVWGETKSETAPIVKGTCEVVKTKNVKTIIGKKCTEYIVKNVEENVMISYWITTDKIDFFIPLVKLWNRKDKASVYFNHIKDLPKGSMPMISNETTLDGTPIGKLEVTKLEKKTIDVSLVSVPADYTKFKDK